MSSNLQNLKWHSEGLLSKMSEMRDSQTLTDVTLKVCGKSFDAHRVVLAASSKYFCAMFTARMRESFQNEIELKDDSLTSAALQIILDFVYRSGINITEDNVFEVLGAADHLQMTSVSDNCWEFMSETLVREFGIQNLRKVFIVAFVKQSVNGQLVRCKTFDPVNLNRWLTKMGWKGNGGWAG